MAVLQTPLRSLRVPLTYMLNDSKGGAWRLGLARAHLSLRTLQVYCWGWLSALRRNCHGPASWSNTYPASDSCATLLRAQPLA
jgi:hypothetical protein